MAPVVTSSLMEPPWTAVFTRMISGLVSQRVTVIGAPGGNGSGSCTPGSRNGWGIPAITPKKTPLDVEVALASDRFPSVGPDAVSTSTCTRMPSYFSSWSIGPEGLVSAAVSMTGVGRGLPVLISVTEGPPEISVEDGLLGSLLGMNSATVPVTCTKLPTVATAVGRLEVKTNTPSEVLGSASTALSGFWMKKPFETTAVTIPVVETSLPATGEVSPGP